MTDELAKVAEDSARGGFFLISGTALTTVIMAEPVLKYQQKILRITAKAADTELTE